MPGPTLTSIRVLATMCGVSAMKGVVLATTMWDGTPHRQAVARENELRRIYWKDMLDAGSTIKRFRNTPESAWAIVASIEHNRFHLDIQVEMGDGQKTFSDSDAGKILHRPRLSWRSIKRWFQSYVASFSISQAKH